MHSWYVFDGVNEILFSNEVNPTPSMGISPFDQEGSYTIIHRVSVAGLPDLESQEGIELFDIDFTDPMISTNPTTWDVTTTGDSEIVVSGTLTVETGVTFTIEEDITVMFCGEDANLIIEPGAKLVLEGTLTDFNGQTWQGVEVQGIPSQAQISSNGYYNQGWFFGKEGALIENAKVAIKNYAGSWSQNTGGVIQCTKMNFLNNVQGIIMRPYESIWPSGYANDRSYFKGCDFSVNNDYSHLSDFRDFIYLYEVRGIKIQGCVFTNDKESPEGDKIIKWGTGIRAAHASFSVTSLCNSGTPTPLPCNNNTPCQFNNLGYAVYAAKKWKNYPYTVRDAVFNDCFVGVRSRGVEGAKIIFNEFNMGVLPDNAIAPVDLVQSGVVFENYVNILDCQENDFINASQNSDFRTVGIFCDRTGNSNKEIRRNTFDGLFCGNLANGVNGNDEQASVVTGLSYRCNKNTHVQTFDIDLGDDPTIAGTTFVRGVQNGREGKAAGNMFSDPAGVSNPTGIINGNENASINYWYDDQGVNEEPSVDGIGEVLPLFADPNTCPTDYCDPPCVDDELVEDVIKVYYDTETSYKKLQSTFESKPSETVVNRLSTYREIMDKAVYKVVRYYLNDTTSSNQEELLTWIGNMNNIASQLWLSNEALTSGNNVKAIGILENIPNKFDLSEEEVVDLKQYRKVTNLLLNQNIEELDAGTLEAIKVYENIGGETGAWVQNILGFYGAHYPPEYVFSKRTGRRSNGGLLEQEEKNSYSVEASPNPAKDFVIFRVESSDENLESRVEVRDMNGRLVFMQEGIKGAESIKWNAENLPSGVYFYRLLSKGRTLQSGKVILNK